MKNLIFALFGFLFGVVLLKSEAVSWFRIQEMFYFQSFHMYGVLFSAIATAAVGVFLIKKLKIRSLKGEPIEFKTKPVEVKQNIIGGTLFGMGWGITGACTAPIYVLVGAQVQGAILVLIGGLIGAFIYGLIKK